jgi:twitching motility protein PilT
VALSSQLEQLLGYLEREGVTQVVFGSGRPIAMRTSSGFTNLTARPLSGDQLASILRGSDIAHLVPVEDGDSEIAEVTVGRRQAVAQVRKRGGEVTVSLTRVGASPPTQPLTRAATPSRGAPVRAPATEPGDSDRPKSTTAVRVKLDPAPAPAALATPPRVVAPPSLARTTTATEPARHVPPAAPALPASLAETPAASIDLEPPATSSAELSAASVASAFDSLSLDDVELGAIGSLELGAIGSLELDTAPASMQAPAMAMPSTEFAPEPDLGFSLELDSIDASSIASSPSSPYAAGADAMPAVGVTFKSAKLKSAPAARARDLSTFQGIVEHARERGASDLHIAANRVTAIRTMNELAPIDPAAPPMSPQAVEALLLPLLDDELRAQLDKLGYVDLALEAPGGGRLRTNISRQQQGLKGTFRIALPAPATLDQLGLPPDIAKVVNHHQGLVIIAGPSGHGKTTTMSGFVDLLNSSRSYHILTIEDPVEIVHPRKQAVISQRETRRHTQSFARGLKASLREDPDVIVIGELRDRESVEIALTAAETGHLVIATMSTPSAAKTLDRLIDMFPPEEHSQVRASVAGALRAIVAQRLLPRRGGGVVPAIELVTGVLPLAVLIREDKLFQLPNLLQRGRSFGMIRFDESLAELVRAGKIDEETALAHADNKKDLATVLRPQAPAAATEKPKSGPLFGFGKKDSK